MNTKSLLPLIVLIGSAPDPTRLILSRPNLEDAPRLAYQRARLNAVFQPSGIPPMAYARKNQRKVRLQRRRLNRHPR